jgi:hypothetical protein
VPSGGWPQRLFQRSVQGGEGGGEAEGGGGETGKPSSQQVFWHSGFLLLPSFLQFFLHLFIDFGGFFLHFSLTG